MQKITIATRESPLALWQTNYIKKQLESLYPDLTIELLPMTTKGDVLLNSPLSKIGGKGLFVKELETALLDGRADIAVHSMKDMPMDLPDGLTLGAICQREDVRDCFISNEYKNIYEMPFGSVLGTSSLRRACQVLHKRPDIKIKMLRGNVGTRIGKLENGEYDAIILASAGLIRLGYVGKISSFIETDEILPAAGQGAIGIECRIDRHLLDLISPLIDGETNLCVQAERALNIALNGGCQVPIAAYAKIDNNRLIMQALVGSVDGVKIIQDGFTYELTDDCILDERQVIALSTDLAQRLLDSGALRILQQIQLK